MSKYDPSKPETLYLDEELEDEVLAGMDETMLRKLMLHIHRLEASDLLMQTGFPIRVKLNNLVFPISRNRVSQSVIGTATKIITKNDDAVSQIMSAKPVNTTYAFKVNESGKKFGVRFRVNGIKDGRDKIQMSCRLNNEYIFKLTDLGHDPKGEIYNNMFPHKGLVLVTGAVDSGKTSFLYACFRQLIEDKLRSAVINTYESPIEGDLEAIVIKASAWNISISQTQVPDGVASFAEGVEESLRRNADIILAGELRTKDEVSGVLDATIQTGKNILATIHSSNLPSTLTRMINTLGSLGEAEKKSRVYDLIESLHMIFSQALLTTVDSRRVATYEYLIFTREIKDRLHAVPVEKVSQEIKSIMLESNRTMTEMTKNLLSQGKISLETYERFLESYSY